MQAKNLRWALFSGFGALLLIVAGVLVMAGPAQAAYRVAAPSGAATATPTGTGIATSTATATPPSGTGCAIQEIEPNSTITDSQQITLIGPTTVDGAITPAGDQDYFKFAITSGAYFWGYVVTNQSAPSTDSILTLMNAAGTTVQLDDDNGFQSTLSSAIAGAPITATGTHLVQVRQFGGATIMSQYFLYMDVTTGAPTEETESNDTTGTADAYTVGQVISGSIPITTDLDLYSFSLAAGDKIVIQVDGDPDRNGTNLSRLNQFNPNFDLLDGAGALITTVDSDSQGGNGGLLSESLVYTATATANFFVQVRADPSTPVEDDTGQYRLHMYKVNCPAGGATATPTSTGTVIPPTGTATATAVPPTSTPDPTAVPPTATQTSTSAPTSTGTVVPATSTGTSVAATNTSTAVASSTVVGATSTAVASSTVVGATSTPMATATVCTVNFPDNQPGDTFYEYIQCLACRGIVTGYPDGMFHAERNITRGQISKMVSNAAGFNEDPGPQIYQDVPPGSTYYAYINRLTNRGIMSGYPCPERPEGDDCDPDNPVIFLPNANATRGQLAKIVSNAAGYNEAVSGQFYADVPPAGQGSQFYEWIMRLTNRGVMSGYACGGPGEPCDGQNRPYFRWNVQVTRGQASKIVANTFFPNCEDRVEDK
ncbi:MAG TPA: S-layer homology domain-containing protein [Chloroflexia bacterium]|jgi:hypothetical protein